MSTISEGCGSEFCFMCWWHRDQKSKHLCSSGNSMKGQAQPGTDQVHSSQHSLSVVLTSQLQPDSWHFRGKGLSHTVLGVLSFPRPN